MNGEIPAASASPAELFEFYGAMDDLVSLSGIDEYTRIGQFLTAPRQKFLETNDGQTIEMRFCMDNTLELNVYTPDEDIEFFSFGLNDQGEVTAHYSIHPIDDSEEYTDSLPVTSAKLEDLRQLLGKSREPINMNFLEMYYREIAASHAAFERKATAEELREYVSLTDELISMEKSQEERSVIHARMQALMDLVNDRPE